MVNRIDKNKQRLRRHRRVRGDISGTALRPRLCVFRSSAHIYAQIIDDVAGTTLCAASSTEKDLSGSGNKETARRIGKAIAERAKGKGITNVVFDRGGFLYHGRVQELAEGAREGGLQF